MINTIIFDIGNVLVQFRWKEYLTDCGYDEETIEKIGRATVKTDLWKEWDRGVIDEDEMIRLCCAQDPTIEQGIRALFHAPEKLIEVYHYSTELVKQLKANGYQVYLLSNYSKNHFEIDKEYFDFIPHVDGGIISYEIKHVKPEPEIYEALIAKYKFNPEEAVFLDDLTENLKGAADFGIHTILVRSYEQILEDLRGLGVKI